MSTGKQNRIGKDLLELLVFLYCNATPADVLKVQQKHVREVRKELRR